MSRVTTVKILESLWFLFLMFMFIGSKYFGDLQDLVFWGVILIINTMIHLR
jgi:hypothetical protein